MLNQSDIMPAPEFPVVVPSDSKWEREHQTFLQLLPELLPHFAGQYVAIHDGQLVGSGIDQAQVALAAYAKLGYQPIYVGLVSDGPQQPARIASPRIPAVNP